MSENTTAKTPNPRYARVDRHGQVDRIVAMLNESPAKSGGTYAAVGHPGGSPAIRHDVDGESYGIAYFDPETSMMGRWVANRTPQHPKGEGFPNAPFGPAVSDELIAQWIRDTL